VKKVNGSTAKKQYRQILYLQMMKMRKLHQILHFCGYALTGW